MVSSNESDGDSYKVGLEEIEEYIKSKENKHQLWYQLKEHLDLRFKQR